MNDECERTKARQFLAEEAHIFPGRPRVYHFRRASIAEKTGPISIDLGKAADGVMLLA